MIVAAYKAQAIETEGEIESLVLTLARPYPNGGGTYAEQQAHMQSEARKIVTALHNTLPQGTWAALVGEVAAFWARDQIGIVPAGRFAKHPDGEARP